MPRKKVINKKEMFEEIQHKMDSKKNADGVEDTLDLVKHAGGSINNLPVKTKAFQGWLQAHQESNPFIGKHAHYSPEDSSEEVQLDDKEELVGNEAASYINKADESAKEFDANSEFGGMTDNLGPALKDDDDHDKKFIDITITENMTRKLLSRSDEDIVNEANKAMKTYHSNDNYVSPIDIESIVESSKILFIEDESSNKKLLK